MTEAGIAALAVAGVEPLAAGTGVAAFLRFLGRLSTLTDCLRRAMPLVVMPRTVGRDLEDILKKGKQHAVNKHHAFLTVHDLERRTNEK